MNRLRNIFSRLQWKLTFSYTLVTSAVVLVILAIMLLVAWTLVFESEVLGTALVGVMNPMAEDLATVLASSPAPEEAAAAWLEQHHVDRSLALSQNSLQTSVDDVVLTAVVDREGRLLAAKPGAWANLEALPAAAQTVVNRALAAEPTAARSIRDERTKGLFLAAPLRAEEGDILGALLVQVEMPQSRPALLQSILLALAPVALPIVVVAGFVGTIFGFVASRSLTRRLRRLAETADGWSQGDFTLFVRDLSADEIGQLGRRLNLMAEQLENLLQARQELAAVDERNRLARELHDAVKQQVFATSMQIGAAQARLEQEPELARQHLLEAARLAQKAQQELSSLIQELRPASLTGRGLSEALQEYVQDWQRQSGVAATLHVQGARPLPLHVEQALFRIVQEALANVARHSGAQAVTLHLRWRDGRLALEVADDGCGFVPAAVDQGYGLQSMQQRAAALEGELTVKSEPGSGTIVRVMVPLPQDTLS